MYYNSVVVLRPDGLYRATIRYTYMYLFTSEQSETFRTLEEANDWILKKRCPNHSEVLKEEDEITENDETTEIKENVFENDSDSEEDTEQKRNERLNVQYNKEKVMNDLKKKPMIIHRRQNRRKWVKFKN